MNAVTARDKPASGIWPLVPILTLAVALRGFNLGERNTWYDEIVSILFAEKGLDTIVQATATDTMPPLYYFLLHYWIVLGDNLWVARSLSVVLGAAMVVVTFAIARRLFGTRVALFASLLVGVNPFQVYHGQEVRMYTLLGFSQLLLIYFLLRCLATGGWGNWIGFILAQSVAMYTHNAAFLSLLTVDAFTLGFGLFFLSKRRHISDGSSGKAMKSSWGRLHKEPFDLLRELFLANLAIACAFLPWLGFLPGQLAKVTRAFWTEMPGITEVIRAMIVFTFNLPSPTREALPILLAVSLLLFALVAFSVAKTLRTREETFSLVFAMSMFAGPIAFAILVSIVRPIFVERVLITSSVLYLVLLAWAMDRLRPRFMAVICLLSVMVLVAWSLVSYYGYDGFPRAAFPKATDYLEGEVAAGDVIVHDNKLTFFPGYYLNRGLPQQFLADPEWSINDTLAEGSQEALGLHSTTLEKATDGKRRVWFVIFSRALEEAGAQGRVHENKDWLDRRYRVEREIRFGDLAIYLYLSSTGDAP